MKTARWTGIALLFFLAVSAIIGAIPMLADPHGTPWSMPQSLLQFSPFPSYFIPGIVLLAANGLLASWILWLALDEIPGYGLWIVLQGGVLLAWLVVECLMIRLVVWPHYLYRAVALGLIATGALLWLNENRPEDLPAPFGENI
ncbi:MAG TPA: hypothetical protein VGL22_15710 [Terracidiphilus sp.]